MFHHMHLQSCKLEGFIRGMGIKRLEKMSADAERHKEEDQLPVAHGIRRSQSCPDFQTLEAQMGQSQSKKSEKSCFDEFFVGNGRETAAVISRFVTKNYNFFGGRDAIINFVFKDDIYGRMEVVEREGHEVMKEYDAKRLPADRPYFGYGVTKTSSRIIDGATHPAIYHVEVLEESPKYIQDAIYRALHQGHKDGMGLVYIYPFSCTPSNKVYKDCCLQIKGR